MQIQTHVTGRKMRDAMELDQLTNHIRQLIALEETEAPVVSCYVARDGRNSSQTFLDQRAGSISKVLDQDDVVHFRTALDRIQRYLATEIRPTTCGVALFARAGFRPYFLGLQFQVPVPNQLSINSTPDIYHLVELKDAYHRYVVLLATEQSARILEVNLGAITREIWAQRPELRKRVGREWTHEHYQNHLRNRSDRFLKEKIAIVERLMAAAGHTHLIIAGSAPITARIRNSLPKHLQSKVVDVVPASSRDRITDVVTATLSSFIECEQQESIDAVAALLSGVKRNGLVAIGTVATLEALQRGQASTLIMDRSYEPEPGWMCDQCGSVGVGSTAVEHCPSCACGELRSANLKETMIKLAERQSVSIELVERSDVLMRLGGVGCMLRYALPAA